MSNFTDFFPTAAGNADITDPDRIPKTTLIASSTTYIPDMFWTALYNGSTATLSNSSNCPYFGTSNLLQGYDGGRVHQSANNTEITLANVTSGSGYLCCVVTPVGAAGTTQEIKITVDGGTEKTYTIDYSSNTYSNSNLQRLVWGFVGTGNSDNFNLANDTTNGGILGSGATGVQYGDTSVPPMYPNSAAVSMNRLFVAHEFKNFNLPRLRFESSILVKCKTTTLYNVGTSDYTNNGVAIYYLDSQL